MRNRQLYLRLGYTAGPTMILPDTRAHHLAHVARRPDRHRHRSPFPPARAAPAVPVKAPAMRRAADPTAQSSDVATIATMLIRRRRSRPGRRMAGTRPSRAA